MLAHLPFLQKIWDKGVDIGAAVIASTISAGIVAGIATATWRWNKRRDLKHEEAKQRQQHGIAAEFANQERQQEAQERLAGLIEERKNLATAAQRAGNHEELAELWERYVAWMESRHLQNLLRNATTLARNPLWSRGLRAATARDLDHNKRTMEQIIRETELPTAG